MSKRLLTAGLLMGLLIASCGLNNTMYNARKYFRAAQARPLNSNGKPTPQAVDEYTKTIQKCGIIITERKGSKVIDDALFLLARALYYKGNSAFQAKDQFEALIAGFPQSPHVPEAHIYLARVLRQINRPQDAEKLLEGFVRDARYLKHHPRALLVLAEFEIGDKDYARAQFWLQRIITDYARTPEFREAFFLFGKNYYEQKDYSASLREFEKFVSTRGISKELRMEGRYYMALNLLELGELDRSYKLVASLINEESRPEKLSQVRVLKARLLLAGSDPAKGVTEVDDISKAYPRSLSSAAAYYYLGDHHFYRDKDITKATTAYNKVRTEFPASEFVTPSQLKVTALNQIKQNQNLSVTGNIQQFVDYHLLAADNFINAFALTDSALAMYDRVLLAPAPVRVERDSLGIRLDSLQARADSLDLRITELEAILAAKAPAASEQNEDPEAGAGLEPPESPDPSTETSIADSTFSEVSEPEIPALPEPADSLKLETQKLAESDSTSTAAVEDPLTQELESLRSSRTQTGTQLASVNTRIKELDGILTRFDSEILPLVYFAKASLLKRKGAPETGLREIQAIMESSFPNDKYTNALRMLIAGQPIRLVDPEEDRQASRLDMALGLFPAQPDSMRVLLEELAESPYSDIRLRANFRLAWLYSFDLADTTGAKVYLDKVLEHPQGGDYATAARKFYDGKNFKFPKPAPDSLAQVDSLSVDDPDDKADEPSSDQEEELKTQDTPSKHLPELIPEPLPEVEPAAEPEQDPSEEKPEPITLPVSPPLPPSGDPELE